MIQAVHELIADLQRQRDVIDERLRLAAELLNTFDPTDPNDPVVVEPDAPPTKASKSKKRAKPTSKRVTCPDCGETFDERGLGVHRSRKHPNSAAKPVQSVQSVPGRDPRDDFGDDVYRCSSCSHEEPNEAGIRQHTMRVHSRPASDSERQAA